MNKPYWLEGGWLKGKTDSSQSAEIIIVGSGLSGVSCAYWLQEFGYKDLLLIDDQPEIAASFRNCGHILYGTVESMKALSEIHGEEVARQLWGLSIEICHEVRETVRRHNLKVQYRQDGYLVIAIDPQEDQEIRQSIQLLRKYGFPSEYVEKKTLENWGFSRVFGGRYEPGSAQAHPGLFRDELLKICLQRGLRYHSEHRVLRILEKPEKIGVVCENRPELEAEALVIAANAYSPLFSQYFARHRLVEPYRGQIITSEPLQHDFRVKYPHSFDHGYEYALVTQDNRLMIGGWRNHTDKGEVGIYSLETNALVEEGLKEFVRQHYQGLGSIRWDYSWSGIMAASRTGFPFIGPLDNPRIFTCAGYSGHGFSWAHGSARYLAKIISGEEVPALIRERMSPRVGH